MRTGTVLMVKRTLTPGVFIPVFDAGADVIGSVKRSDFCIVLGQTEWRLVVFTGRVVGLIEPTFMEVVCG